MTTVTVAGASGYAGGELLRYLAQHPTYDLIAACAAGRAGEALGTVHPQFSATPWADLILDETSPSVLGQADLVFAALPRGVSRFGRATARRNIGGRIWVRTSGWSPPTPGPFYGGTHAGSWTYGLAELPGVRGQIAAAPRRQPGLLPDGGSTRSCAVGARGGHRFNRHRRRCRIGHLRRRA